MKGVPQDNAKSMAACQAVILTNMIYEGDRKRSRLESETRVSTFDNNDDFFFFEKQRTCPITLSALLFLASGLVFSGPWDLGWSLMEIGFELDSGLEPEFDFDFDQGLSFEHCMPQS